MPPMMEIILRYLLILCKYVDAEPMLNAIARNGIASPREKTDNRKAPWPTVPPAAASVKMEPRMGPTHGVHPKLNAAPKIRELAGLPGFKVFTLTKCLSIVKNGNLKMPIINNPKSITKIPPIHESHIR